MTHAAKASLLMGILVLTGCAQYGIVHDGTSVSFGQVHDGWLVNGVRLPARGDGYRVPPRWVQRGNIYGTDELVAMIPRVARRVQRETGQRLGVADLSPPGGGSSRWHRTHQTGRDVDLLLFAVDRRGRPLKSEAMVRFMSNGRSHLEDTHGVPHSRRYFDAKRNWALIRALLEEPTVEIQNIYIYEPLKQILLAHARAAGEPDALVARADAVMAQPVNSSKHHDHIHVRIYCADSDRSLGCRDSRSPGMAEARAGYRKAVVRASEPLVRAMLQLALLVR